MTRFTVTNHERLLKIVCGLSVIAVLVAKVFLIWRININWDEFYFLSHVYSLARGDLDQLMQTAYTHLFVWATWREADEIVEIRLLRLSMWPLLALSCFLLYRLARRWASPVGAWFTVFAFVASWPVLTHGLSFRADSLLLPLTLAALLLAGNGQRRVHWGDVGCGVLVGLAMTLTVKAALLLPTLVAVLCLETIRSRNGPDWDGNFFLRRLAVVACTGGISMALVLAAHANFIAVVAERPEALLSRAFSGSILDVPWVPRWNHFQGMLARDPLTWFLIAAGLVAALVRKHYGAAACASSLLPILFYRNAFPYYYVVMLAPASVVIAVAIDGIRTFAVNSGRPAAGTGMTFLFFLLLAHGAWGHVMALRFDEQGAQRSVVAAVHRIFPEPVPYVDHSGMIASFPKVNFFMSSWGVENYLEGGQPFMPAVLADRCPPLLVVDHPVLAPRSLLFRKLQQADRQILEEQYVDYWGPIRVAGTAVKLTGTAAVAVRVACPGTYRIEADAPVLVDGRRLSDGDVVVLDGMREYQVESDAASPPARSLRFVWAEARDPPAAPPPKPGLYDPL